MDDYPPALLTYTLTPDTVSRSSGVSPSTVALMLAVNNASGRDLTCEQIGFTLRAGDGAAQLTADVAAINTAVTGGTHWSFQNEDGNFTAIPDVGYELLRAGESIAFQLTDIAVNQVAGLVVIDIYETIEPDTTRMHSATVTKVDQTLGITRFSADPPQVVPGAPSVLTWTTSGAKAATLSDGRTSTSVKLNDSESVTPMITTTYTLTAEGVGPPVAASLTIAVPEVRILDFEAYPDEVAPGGTTRLTWQVLGASSAYIYPGRHVLENPEQGCLYLVVDKTTTFDLEAFGHPLSDSKQASVTVPPVVIDSFATTPTGVASGEPATLSWTTTWAGACRIDPGVGVVPTNGSHVVSPSSTTTYQLTADGYESTSVADATLVVGAAITAFGFTADPANPAQVLLSWTTCVDDTGTVVLSRGNDTITVPAVAEMLLPVPMLTVLTVDAGATPAKITIFVAAPLLPQTAGLTDLALACPAGLNTPGATASVRWTATAGPVAGVLKDAHGEVVPVSGTSGTLPFAIGAPDPRGGFLWTGQLMVGERNGVLFGVW